MSSVIITGKKAFLQPLNKMHNKHNNPKMTVLIDFCMIVDLEIIKKLIK